MDTVSAEYRNHIDNRDLSNCGQYFLTSTTGLVPKVRDIGSALLDEMRVGDSQLNSGESDGSGAFSSQEASLDLRRLLEKLERLDFRPWDDGYQRRSFITSETLRM